LNLILERTTSALPEREIKHYGPKILSSLLFHEQSVDIYRETGVDVYLGQSIWDLTGLPKFDWRVRHRQKIVHAIKQGAPKGGTWETVEVASESGHFVSTIERRVVAGQVVELRACVDHPYFQQVPLEEELTEAELAEKRRHQAAKARASKAAYREDDRTDAVRFGFCKRRDCPTRLERRLVIRSLCPDCRQKPEEAVSATPTATERRQRVLKAREAHPEAGQRELSALTGVSQAMVHRYLTSDSTRAKSDSLLL
jgi:hypothetical protein